MTAQSTFTPPVQIRAATPADAPVVYDFLCVLEETTLDKPTFYSIYEQNLANPTIYYRVAEQAGEVVGFVSCHVQWLLHHGGKVGEIQELFVRPAIRQQGVGRQLLADLNDLAVRENFINLEVTTNQKRLDAFQFYERLSFNPSHYKFVKPIQS